MTSTLEDFLDKLDDLQYNKFTWPDGRRLEVSNSWDRRFITDVNSHVAGGNAVSTAQAEIIIKLVSRYRTHLETTGIDASKIDAIISYPQYRRQPHHSTRVAREVRWAGNNYLAFRCKYNAVIIEDIKKLKGYNPIDAVSPWFNRELKLWIVRVDRGNLEKTMAVIKNHNFVFDGPVETFFLNAFNAIGQISQATVIDDNILIDVKDDDLLDKLLGTLCHLGAVDV